MQIETLAKALVQGEKKALAKAMTLIESRHRKDEDLSEQLLLKLAPYSGQSIRIGMSGIPGVGKSTLISLLGKYILAGKAHRLGILAIDPSSPLSGGSILADKTRMSALSHHPDVYIRPSPHQDSEGGVGRKSRDKILLLEAAGYNIIIIETVGVGQTEHLVSTLVDAFVLIHMPASGDELQSIKRGILELSDFILINKADGLLKHEALIAKNIFSQLAYFGGDLDRVLTCSALEDVGVFEIWKNLQTFIQSQKLSHKFEERRNHQISESFETEFFTNLKHEIQYHKVFHDYLKTQKQVLLSQNLPLSIAARHLAKDLLAKIKLNSN